MNKDTVMKSVLVGVLVLALVSVAVYIGWGKFNQSSWNTPLPEPIPLVPDLNKPTSPAPVYSESYIQGYSDGYSGAWVAPAKWVVVSEYRVGHHAGRLDRSNAKPNKFDK